MSDTSGLFSPTQVFRRVGSRTWVPGEELGGMVLIAPTSVEYTGTAANINDNGSVGFSAVTSLSLNGCFTATYDNYMVVVRANDSTDNNHFFRLLSGGTAATTLYHRQYLQANDVTISAGRAISQDAGALSPSSSDTSGYTAFIYAPHVTKSTHVRTTTVARTTVILTDWAFVHSLSNSYDGFMIFPDTGNITGSLSVYGLVGA